MLTEKPYAYCDGDPVNNVDPDGHQKKKHDKNHNQPNSGPPPPNRNLSDEQKFGAAVVGGFVGLGVGVITKNKGAGVAAGAAAQYATWKVEEYWPVIQYYQGVGASGGPYRAYY